MTELQEFIYLLHRHPELIAQLRQIAEDEASRSEFREKQNEKSE